MKSNLLIYRLRTLFLNIFVRGGWGIFSWTVLYPPWAIFIPPIHDADGGSQREVHEEEGRAEEGHRESIWCNAVAFCHSSARRLQIVQGRYHRVVYGVRYFLQSTLLTRMNTAGLFAEYIEEEHWDLNILDEL